jgi:hypothetical protein
LKPDPGQPAAPTPYPELNTVLRALAGSARVALGANFYAACLQGSFAVGDFDAHSDVDFTIVTQEELSEAQLGALQAMHERIYHHMESPWAQHLEGSYFPRAVLRDYRQRGRPLWYLDHGSQALIEHPHDNTVVVRWVVREYGIPLAGPHPSTLVEPIPIEALRQETLEIMRTWGRQIQADPQIINNRFYQAFAVLHYARMLHDLHTGHPGSKRAGAEWVKAALDPKWAGLIDRSWSGRPDPARSSREPADPEDLERTVDFVRHVMALGEEYARQSGLAGVGSLE